MGRESKGRQGLIIEDLPWSGALLGGLGLLAALSFVTAGFHSVALANLELREAGLLLLPPERWELKLKVCATLLFLGVL